MKMPSVFFGFLIVFIVNYLLFLKPLKNISYNKEDTSKFDNILLKKIIIKALILLVLAGVYFINYNESIKLDSNTPQSTEF
jgi:uncharacterized membrane protein